MSQANNSVIEILSRLCFLYETIERNYQSVEDRVEQLKSTPVNMVMSQLSTYTVSDNQNAENSVRPMGDFENPLQKIVWYLLNNLWEANGLGVAHPKESKLATLGRVKNGIQMARNYVKDFGYELIEFDKEDLTRVIRGFRVNGRTFLEGDLT